MDETNAAKYIGEIKAIRQFVKRWSKLLLGWEDIAEWKYL